ncbi:hypothetical protein [Halogeometricum limi]|uniref:Uncharacterized protein n=1 Tax=Halogeometricum limi TaxID=555875 RepID=A0A1I6GKZ4_9EURY|nr:hypothetical protein [Halogeometricum limi]SFR42811.1 hypothetical protein SAMN04488124_1198 [Halogeometricum limi]
MEETTRNSPETRTRYHVVCRDCPTESVERDGNAAEEVAHRHESETAHRVVVGAVAAE